MADATDTAARRTCGESCPGEARDLTEAVFGAAVVLARLSGNDRITVAAVGNPWRRQVDLPRAGSVARVLRQLGRVPGDAATVSVTGADPRGHRVLVRRPDDVAHTWWTSDDSVAERARQVLRAARRAQQAAIRDLPVLTQAERDAHAELCAPPRVRDGIDVVEALRLHAILRPHAVAVVEPSVTTSSVTTSSVTTTYAELDASVSRFAAGLRSLGAGPADVVAFVLPRSTHLVVAVLGALRAGVTFTTVSPRNPAERVRRTIADAGARFVVANGPDGAGLDGASLDVAGLDGGTRVFTPAQVAAAHAGAGELRGAPADQAYVMFTSGSTGRPKGVVISRSALRGYLAAILPAYGLTDDDRVPQIVEPGFDVLLEEVLPTIAAGARVVIADPSCLDSPASFLAFARTQGITVVNLSSSLWIALFAPDAGDASAELAALPPGIRLVVVGSERVPASAYLAWLDAAPRHVRLVNAYGTTETTITSIVHDPLYDAGNGTAEAARAIVRRTGSVPIGRPLANTTVRVVDAHGDPTRFGAPGELVIGGASVFSGYLGAPRTAPDYRTGDLVTLDASGALLHLGRLDAQVKIRGRRIEPAEVEAALEALPEVRRALCTTIGSEENTRLVAAVVPAVMPDGPPDGVPGPAGLRERLAAGLRERLAAVLPEWLVPEIVITNALPVNGHGKADPVAVRTLFSSSFSARPAAPEPATPEPATPEPALPGAEDVVAACVAELLGCPRPGPADNFFALGGNSVQAIRLVARLAKRLGHAVPARQVFLTPTIAEIARAFDSPRPDVAPIVRREQRGEFPLTPGQQAMLRFLGSPRRPRPYFEMSEAFRITGPLNRRALRSALRDLVRENEPLRSTIDPAGQRQLVLADWVPTMEHVDLSQLGAARRGSALEREVRAARRPFDLTTQPAFRAVLVRLAADEHVLLLTFHHLFFDGWSYGLCYERLGELYGAEVAGVAASRPPARPEFGDYAQWLTEACTDEVRGGDIAYWRRALAGHRPPELCQRLAPRQCTSTAASHPMDAATTAALEGLATSCAVSPFAVLYATFAIVLSHVVDHADLLLASNDANRYQVGTAQMMGYLSVSQLSRIVLAPDDSFAELAGRAHATLATARQHTSVQWEDLVAELGLTNAVHFRFSLQDTPSAGVLDLPGLTVQLLPEKAESGGRRAVVVNVWRRTGAYEVQWYSRDDLELAASPRQALEMFAATLRRGVADPRQDVAALRRALPADAGADR